jgi:hypothetical protein
MAGTAREIWRNLGTHSCCGGVISRLALIFIVEIRQKAEGKKILVS